MKKKWIWFIVVPLLFIPTVMATLLYVCDSGLPDNTSAYGNVSVISPDGSELIYSSKKDVFSIISSMLEGADDKVSIKSDEGYQIFNITFIGDGTSSGFELLISEDKASGIIRSHRGDCFNVDSQSLTAFLTSSAAASMYLGTLPPDVDIYGTLLSPSIVEWSEVLNDGVVASSGKYMPESIREYRLESASLLKQITFESLPSDTEVSVYLDGTLQGKSSLDDFDPSLPGLFGEVSIILVAKWDTGDCCTVRAGYSFIVNIASPKQ